MSCASNVDELPVVDCKKPVNGPFKVPICVNGGMKKPDGSSASKVDDDDKEIKDKESLKDSSLNVGESSEAESEKPCPGTKFGYKIPTWSELPDPTLFELKEIKGGVTERTIKLRKSFYVFGRKDTNDIKVLNPTTSRHHLVLQFGDPSGGHNFSWYLYDMASANGSYLNKKKVSSHTYIKIESGFIFQLGYSKRFFELRHRIVCDPTDEIAQTVQDDDDDDDDDEDFDRDLTYYLKQWFKNEGLEEGSFFNVEKLDEIWYCKIRLPLKEVYGEEYDDFEGKGRDESKSDAVKEAVCNCWDHLESIGITPAGTKRKRNWKENDYYDSDEDPFFDRTGDLEKKRLKRMKSVTTVIENCTIRELRKKSDVLKSEKKSVSDYIDYLNKELITQKDGDSFGDEITEYKEMLKSDLAKKKSNLSEIDSQIKSLEDLIEKEITQASRKAVEKRAT